MRATFTQDQLDIESTVRGLVADEKVSARDALTAPWSPPACDATLLGDFTLLGVPETSGGMGSGLIDLLVAVEALGESLLPSRFPAHAGAVQLLAGAGLEVPADVLDGTRVLTVALDAPGSTGWSEQEGDRRTLVRHAGQADAVASLGAGGVALGRPAEVVARESFDPSVPMADVTLGPAGEPAARAAGSGALRATLVVAAELSGVAQGAIALAADYARTRKQFGAPIGSFQAVAFQLAEAVAVRKAAWDLTLYAAWAVENGRADALSQVHAAKAAAGKAAIFAAERCIQVHGGMGITMEADPHLFLRRAFVLDAVAGRGGWHRRRVGELRLQAHRDRA